MPQPTNEPISLQLLTDHQRSLGTLAAHLLSDHHGGEDVVRDAFSTALAPSHSVHPRSIGAWLQTVVRRLAGRERHQREARGFREKAATRVEALPSAAELVSRAETARVLHEAVERLEPNLATVVRDVYFGELSIRDIARRDGTPSDTLRSRLKRARVLLRKDLEKRGAELQEDWAVAFVRRWCIDTPLYSPF